MSTIELPPLPLAKAVTHDLENAYTADQMRAYALEAVREDRARVAEALSVVEQAFLEMYQAKMNPNWFTKGQTAATQHFLDWCRRGRAAIAAARE